MPNDEFSALKRERDELVRQVEEAEAIYDYMGKLLSDPRFVGERDENRAGQKAAHSRKLETLRQLRDVDAKMRSLDRGHQNYISERMAYESKQRNEERDKERRSRKAVEDQRQAKQLAEKQRREKRQRSEALQKRLEGTARDAQAKAIQEGRADRTQEQTSAPEPVSPAQEAEERAAPKDDQERLKRELKDPELLLQRKQEEEKERRRQERLAYKARKEQERLEQQEAGKRQEREKEKSRDAEREPDW